MMNESNFYVHKEMWMYKEGQLRPTVDVVVREVQLGIFVNGSELVRIACSPVDLKELAAGYAISEGLLKEYDDLLEIEQRSNHEVWLDLKGEVSLTKEAGQPIVNTCMGRGQLSPDQVTDRKTPSINDEYVFQASKLLELIAELDDKALTFKKTGGVHSAGLGGDEGLLARYEDIGRHNAVDKAFGYAFLNRIPLHDKCLVLSGRIAGEILMKASNSGVSLILSRSAPTLRTVELADWLGMTIVGFARGERFNVYTHPQRIGLD